MFQHANAPVYKASSMKTWFGKIGVEELKWPKQSSDLNPIENRHLVKIASLTKYCCIIRGQALKEQCTYHKC